MGLGGWLVFRLAAVSRPAGARSFSLRAQRKRTKRKGTPQARPPGALPGSGVFQTGPPWPAGKWPGSIPATLRAFSSTRPPLPEGRGSSAVALPLSRAIRHHAIRRLAKLFIYMPSDAGQNSAVSSPAIQPGGSVLARSRQFKLDVGAGARGPSAGGGAWRIRPAGWPAGRRPFSSGPRRARLENPGTRNAPEGRRTGVAFSLVRFSFPQKRNERAPAGRDTAARRKIISPSAARKAPCKKPTRRTVPCGRFRSAACATDVLWRRRPVTPIRRTPWP